MSNRNSNKNKKKNETTFRFNKHEENYGNNLCCLFKVLGYLNSPPCFNIWTNLSGWISTMFSTVWLDLVAVNMFCFKALPISKLQGNLIMLSYYFVLNVKKQEVVGLKNV